jgi:hypothetical protein
MATMTTDIQHAPNLPSDLADPLVFASSPANGPRVQQSRSKSAAIRRGEIKISNPIPIDNVVLVNRDEAGHATTTTVNKRHTDPTALVSAATELGDSQLIGANTSKKLVRNNNTASESTLRPSTAASHKSDPFATGLAPSPVPAIPTLLTDNGRVTPVHRDNASFQQSSSVDVKSEPRETGEDLVQYTATVTSRGSPSPMRLSKTDPPRDRRSGEKKGLRGALRKMFGRKSKGPNAEQRRSRTTPVMNEYEREVRLISSTAQSHVSDLSRTPV